MLSTEETLVVSYGSTDETINLMDGINEKKQSLTPILEETTMRKGINKKNNDVLFSVIKLVIRL